MISTDMSHYHSYEQARAIDGATIERIAAFATDIHHEEACGATPLNGLLSFSRQKIFARSLLAACNPEIPRAARAGWSAIRPSASTKAARFRSRSRAHAPFPCPRHHRSDLISKPDFESYSSWLNQTGANVRHAHQGRRAARLHRRLQAARALAEDVAQNALGAAFRDPRFPAMTLGEWPQCRVEVSLLSTPKPVRFADEADLLEQIEAGVDGLIVEADGKRATFLPQCGRPRREARLPCPPSRKAGLAGGHAPHALQDIALPGR